jgi:hypothetical protein
MSNILLTKEIEYELHSDNQRDILHTKDVEYALYSADQRDKV